MTTRRLFLQVLGSAGAGAALSQLPVWQAAAAGPTASDEFFVFIHASGGWDVTLWADPRNQRKGIIEPASTDNTDLTGLKKWVSVPLDADTNTFELVRGPGNSPLVFGPGIGNLVDFASRLTVINGIAMNTVSHPDGTTFSATGRHLSGGRPVASSIDALVANEFGAEQLFPVVSVNYPSSLVGTGFDPRAAPLKMSGVGTIARSLTRSSRYDQPAERDAVTALLSQEAQDLARISNDPDRLAALGSQFDSLRRMLGSNLQDVFSQARLQAAHPEFNYRARFQAGTAVNAAFAVEAMKKNVVRAVAFGTSGGFDTHNTNYRNQAQTQAELFDLLAALLQTLDATPHPTRTSDKLSDHTHILVVSDFCRTPQINLTGGRDHYPNNSALVISPRFKGDTAFGKSDPEQLLPDDAGTFADGVRPVAPPDVLATFLAAFGVDPRRYLRDGDVIRGILKP